MLKKLITTVSIVIASLTFTSAAYAAHHGTHKDIVEVATENGNFTTLVAALKAGGLVETLKGEGPFTVFAPTDEAFAKLPEGTVEMLLKPENKDKLVSVLTYHVVAGKVTSTDVAKMDSGTTIQGEKVMVKAEDGKVMINDAQVIMADVEASNGLIHAVDKVLMPK